MTSQPKRRTLAAFAYAAAALSGAAFAQANSTLRIVVPYPAGGSSDQAARILANELQPRLGQTVIVDNVVGAGGRLAMQQIKGLPSDSNVIVLVNPALMVIAPQVFKNIGYDPDTDYQPVSQISRYEMAVAVGAAVPVRELQHLLAWIRANPDKASMGVPATGSIPHFFALMLGKAAGTTVPIAGYKGSAPLVTDLIGGHIPVAIDALDSLITQHQAGKVKVLATSGEKRSEPTIPTLKESGLNLTATGWNTFYAKATMPADRVNRLAAEISAVMKLPAVREKFVAAKAEPVSSTLAQTKETLKAFKSQWLPVIQQANLKFD
jgi:tripartite-type tricarboxylate transporter receptor subunit TctC